MEKCRNGKLDVLKFIMTINIVALHYWWRPQIVSIGNKQLTFGKTGYYAVIFFFLVSGALLVRSFYFDRYTQNSPNSVGRETQNFIMGKMRKFLPLYMWALFLYILKDIIVDKSLKNVLENMFYTIPSCLMLGQTGFDNKGTYIGGYYVGASWYLSALLIMMFIAYPLLLSNYDLCTKVVAPIILILALYINVSVIGTNVVDSRLYPVIPFVLGIIVGDISIEASKSQMNNKICVWGIHIVELFCAVMLQVFLCIDISEMRMAEYPMLFLTATLVCIVCVNITPGKDCANRVTGYLGKLSFALYLIHGSTYELLHEAFIHDTLEKGSNLDFIISLLVSICMANLWLLFEERLPKAATTKLITSHRS